MPIYQYEARDEEKGCPSCVHGFECPQGINDPPIAKCPRCGGPVRRVISPPMIGASKTTLDRRAKDAGFTQYKRLGKGEYEKKF